MKLKEFLRQCALKKDGIKLVNPDSNLCASYIGLAQESLDSMNANLKAGVKRWALVAAYYARYHALYAVFMKIGIKCEIHDCTLAVAELLLGIKPQQMKEIKKAKTHRINMQYYADRTVSDEEYRKNINSAASFVIMIEELAARLTEDDVKDIRNKLERAVGE